MISSSYQVQLWGLRKLGYVWQRRRHSFGAGGKRGIGLNEERDQTLNQLLTELDGFESRTGVLLLAATNRPEVRISKFLFITCNHMLSSCHANDALITDVFNGLDWSTDLHLCASTLKTLSFKWHMLFQLSKFHFCRSDFESQGHLDRELTCHVDWPGSQVASLDIFLPNQIINRTLV